MPRNRLGKLRRSAAVMMFGPGSVVDFRADGAAVSAVAAGLEEWDNRFPPRGLTNPQSVHEPRLQRKMSVGGFRLAPVVDEERRDADGKPDLRTLMAARFPRWLQCPQCDRIAPAHRWLDDPGRAYRYCAKCTRRSPGQRKVFAVPVRFVMACPKGHLDDFPWHSWVSHAEGCAKSHGRGDLYLRSEGPGLSGLVLRCPECRARRSMNGVFGSDTWSGFQCRGGRPWLSDADEACTSQPRALQRGASNLYFPVIESALSIPPWSDGLQDALGVYWTPIVNVEPEDRSSFIRILAQGDLKTVVRELGYGPEELAQQIDDRVALYRGDAILDIRQEEYRQLASGTDTPVRDARDFEVRNVRVPVVLQPFFSRLVRVVRLREVRALRGFTRINPPGDPDSPEVASLSRGRPDWLPAAEVRGEGIFLAFRNDALRAWETGERIVGRAQRVHEAWQLEWRQRHGDGEPTPKVTPRFLLIHTFAHALMRQLTLESGYSSAALRERLYVGEDAMAGVLVYTATSDSEGTLGGLQRQGRTELIGRAVPAAIRAMEWCSSDPLCIEGMAVGRGVSPLAACHACVLAPETACEEFNRFVDRATLVGLPDAPETGFFSPLLRSP